MPFSSSKRSFRRSGGTSLRSARSSVLDGLGRILIEAVRVVGLAQKAGRAALADHAGFLQRPRQFDKRQHRLLGRLELGDVAARGGKIRRTGRLQLARGRDAVGRIAGEHLVNRRGVIEQAVGRVAHRADQRGLVERVGHHRHVLADMGAGDLGGNRLEFAADVGRRIGLGIPDIDVARPALQEDHDHGFGAAEAARAIVLRRGLGASSARRGSSPGSIRACRWSPRAAVRGAWGLRTCDNGVLE